MALCGSRARRHQVRRHSRDRSGRRLLLARLCRRPRRTRRSGARSDPVAAGGRSTASRRLASAASGRSISIRARRATARSPARPSRAGAAPTCSGGCRTPRAFRPRSTPTSTARRWPRCAGAPGGAWTISLTSPSARASASASSSTASRRAASPIASSATSALRGFPATTLPAPARSTAIASKALPPDLR